MATRLLRPQVVTSLQVVFPLIHPPGISDRSCPVTYDGMETDFLLRESLTAPGRS